MSVRTYFKKKSNKFMFKNSKNSITYIYKEGNIHGQYACRSIHVQCISVKCVEDGGCYSTSYTVS